MWDEVIRRDKHPWEGGKRERGAGEDRKDGSRGGEHEPLGSQTDGAHSPPLSQGFLLTAVTRN